MSFSPRPISLSQVEEGDYEGMTPQGFVVIGDVVTPDSVLKALKALPGYDESEIQHLVSLGGDLSWQELP